MEKRKVAFICVHNSCALKCEAIARIGCDGMKVYSLAQKQRALSIRCVLTIKELYGVDNDRNTKDKLLSEIPPVDMSSQGCNGLPNPAMPAPGGLGAG
jgi:arsenate reductase